jgi:GNAT superfamily N-acetyltransferase
MAERTLRVEAVADAREFARLGGEWLAAHAIDANVIGSNVARALSYDAADRPDNLWFAVLDDSDAVVGTAMHTAGLDVFLPELPAGAAELVAEELYARDRPPPGANGDPEAARAFVLAWRRLTGATWEQADAALLYVLDTLEPPTGVPGGLRLATGADLDLVSAWADDFVAEARAPGMTGKQRDVVARRISAGEILLWTVDDEAVAIAAVSPAVGGVARVNLVYTPPDLRGRGYGAAVSAGVTRTALERGVDVCMLYADVANPASNAVYQRIGYREHCESVVLRFRPPDGSRRGSAVAGDRQSHSTSPVDTS